MILTRGPLCRCWGYRRAPRGLHQDDSVAGAASRTFGETDRARVAGEAEYGRRQSAPDFAFGRSTYSCSPSPASVSFCWRVAVYFCWNHEASASSDPTVDTHRLKFCWTMCASVAWWTSSCVPPSPWCWVPWPRTVYAPGWSGWVHGCVEG